MDKILKTVTKTTPVILLFALFCSNPVKDVVWRSSIDLPITANKKFILAAMMDTLFFNGNQVLTDTTYDTIKQTGKIDTIIDTTMMILKAYPLYDTTKRVIVDTVAFGIPARDTTQYKISEDSLEDKYYSDMFGPLPLSGAANDTVSVQLPPGAFTAGTPISSPAQAITLQYVYHIELMDTPQTLKVTVVNNSPAALGTVALTAGTLGTSTISNLAPNSSATMLFDARAKIIDSIITVSATATPSSGGTFVAGNNLQFIFSFDSLYATKVVALDYLLKGFERTFTNDYKLTDTVSVEFIDIARGFFNYIVTNNTDLEMHMLVTHRNLWMSDFAARHTPPLVSVHDLVGLTADDSATGYEGEITPQIVVINPGQTAKVSSKENLSGFRMFPEWEWNLHDLDSESVTKVDYKITIGTHGTRVALQSSDSLNFIIRTTSFKFDKMYGRTMLEYRRTSDPKNIPVNLPWSKSVTDSLRNNFELQKVFANMSVKINIPSGAFIDTMRVFYDISSVTDSSVFIPDSEVFTNVRRDSVYSRTIDITKVVNNYPDSVKIKASTTVPVNTTIMAVNDLTVPTDTDYTRYVGRMIVKAQANYAFVAPLCWKVVDTTVMDLGGARIRLGDAADLLGLVKKMRDRHDSLCIRVTNNTNVNLKLYGLIATDTATTVKQLVDTLNPGYITTNALTGLINSASPGPGFINLLGAKGLLIPRRDSLSVTTNTVVISDSDLTALLKSDKMAWRWQVRFLPKNNGGTIDTTDAAVDALHSYDWIKLNTWFHIDGINSIDSLFSN